jgi:hypothetical protein
VDRYIPNIAMCLRDESELVRKQTLMLLTKLLQVILRGRKQEQGRDEEREMERDGKRDAKRDVKRDVERDVK